MITNFDQMFEAWSGLYDHVFTGFEGGIDFRDFFVFI